MTLNSNFSVPGTENAVSLRQVLLMALTNRRKQHLGWTRIFPSILSITSFMCGKGYVSFLVTSLRPRKSQTNLVELSFFFTRIIGEFQGDADGVGLCLYPVISLVSVACRWSKIFPNSKKLLRIKLAEVLRKLRKLRDSKTTRKSLNTAALIFN